MQRGVENYSNIMSSPSKPAWTALCHADQSEIEVQEDASDIEAVENEEEESFHRYDPEFVFPSSMTEVEAIENLKFDPEAQMEAPSDLYEHHDGGTETRIRPEYCHLFTHSPSSAFFAYIPVYF